MVAESTSQLCDAANDVVQGEAKEERLIAAAKAVAATTVQLLHAAQVKADIHSENNRRLQVLNCFDVSSLMFVIESWSTSKKSY